mmetsp:Transcript_112954/g.319603  ORF Transcript_112954/g.319603 Transcript_112954/m.319603 type:complete len:220 (+) Transcript_112954:615-1274(+)
MCQLFHDNAPREARGSNVSTFENRHHENTFVLAQALPHENVSQHSTCCCGSYADVGRWPEPRFRVAVRECVMDNVDEALQEEDVAHENAGDYTEGNAPCCCAQQLRFQAQLQRRDEGNLDSEVCYPCGLGELCLQLPHRENLVMHGAEDRREDRAHGHQARADNVRLCQTFMLPVQRVGRSQGVEDDVQACKRSYDHLRCEGVRRGVHHRANKNVDASA